MHKANRLNSLHTKMKNFTSKTLLFYKKTTILVSVFFIKKRIQLQKAVQYLRIRNYIQDYYLKDGRLSRPLHGPATRPLATLAAVLGFAPGGLVLDHRQIRRDGLAPLALLLLLKQLKNC